MKHLTSTKPWHHLLRPTAVASLAVGLSIGVALTTIAQDEATPGVSVDLAESSVALHDGSCNDPALEPEFEIGTLEREAWYADASGLTDGFEPGDIDGDGVFDADEDGFIVEDLDGDGVLDDDEDLNENGVLDAGIDEDGDGVLDDEEIIPNAHPVIAPDEPRTVWEVDAEVDVTFEQLFGIEEDDDFPGNPGIIAVHESPDNYANILACAELSATGWEARDTVVLGLTPTGGSDLYGYAVFERDTGNVPIFGDNTTGVTLYLFEDLPTRRDTQAEEGTPGS